MANTQNTVVPDAITSYFAQIGNYPVLEQEKERELIALAQNGDKEAYDELIKSNLRLVVSVAKRYYKNTTLSLLDLVQEGNIGLMNAIPKFELSQGTRFSTYATQWIRQSISRSVSEHSSTVRIPSHKQKMLKMIKTYIHQYKAENEKDPTIEEIAEMLNIDKNDILDLMPYINQMFSLDSALEDENDSPLSSMIADLTAPSPETEVLKKDDAKIIMSVLNTLTPKEKEVIILRFGLDGNTVHTLEEIGEHFHVTKERIRQIEETALRKLRHPSRTNILKQIA